MAERFVRVDLSDEARDFRPVAVEPGVPLLDRSNANAKILYRWLGGYVADPVWEDESVNFYARDDQGGRLEEVEVQTASADDLKSILKDDLANLQDRLAKAHPETSSERALKKAVLRNLESMVNDPHRHDLDDYFFRYRDVQGRWRLVWCWGYERINIEPAVASVCTDPDCALLFVRRPGLSQKCPSCEKGLVPRTKKKRRWRRLGWAALLLLLAAASVYHYWTHQPRLIAVPDAWHVPIGGRVEFKIYKAGLFTKEDVSRRAVPIVLDPRVARLDPNGTSARAINLGSTLVRFHLGNLKCDATLSVGEAKNPDKLVIEPRTVELGINTTARLKAIGHYDDGSKVDLSDVAEWSAQDSKIVFAYNGLVEGLAEGTTTVVAKYRAPQEKSSVDASATVAVAKINFTSLQASVEPNKIGAGRSGQLHIDAISDEGKAYSVLESSMLNTNIAPGYVATVLGQDLRGDHIGLGKLAAGFGETLKAGSDFEVIVSEGLDKLTVYPEKIDMAVGEITDLSIASPFGDPIAVASSNPAIVEVTAEHRLVARGEGAANVEVSQASQRRTVEVTVTKADFASIAIDPARLIVPLDDTVHARVMGRIEGGRNVELAPDLIATEKAPSPRFVAFEPRAFKLRGVRPTEAASPQTLAVRMGPLQASASVEVIVPPFRLTLTPTGPIDLPLGQMMRLQGLAAYGSGLRVQVPSGRLDWRQQGKATDGIQLRGDKVASLKAGGGPLSVYAAYFGRESNRVVFKSVEAGPVTLKLDMNRTIRLTGETGAAMLSGADPKGDVELVPEMASFKSSDPNVLKIDEKSGIFRAVAPGKVTITASHAAAQQPATLDAEVYDPAKARLVFSSKSVQLAVDEVVPLQLFLEVEDGGKTKQAALVGPGVGYAVAQPDAVRWLPPMLAGMKPAKPFELTASYTPYLNSTASTTVEVVAAQEPVALRIVPSRLSCAPGQKIALRVEEQEPGSDAWKEVRPDAVAWTPPADLLWTPGTNELRPTATLPNTAKGDYELLASYGGKQAAAILTANAEGPDPNAADTKLSLAREPGGEFLAVGRHQRYNVMVEKDGSVEPAAKIDWPENFENQYVSWQAPVLTAKQAGYEQWIRAMVGNRVVLFRTNTYEPGKFEASQSGDRPVAVKIVSDQGPAVQMPIGSEFDDFRVEAHYADGFTRVVTKKATLRTPEPVQSSIVTPSAGRLVGVRAGTTSVSAEFEGVTSKEPLKVQVTADVDIDEIRITPSLVNMLRGETVALQASGFKGGKSVGILSGLGKLAWKSSNPQVAPVTGPSVTGQGLGQADVTASLGQFTSRPCAVNVVASIEGELTVDPKVIRLRVGEGAQLGTNLAVYRGNMDASGQVIVTTALPGVVRFVPETRTLVGVGPGVSSVALAMGDKLKNITVEVTPNVGPIDGTVVVEPANVNLAPGQAVPMRVFVVTADGRRFDRTDAAVLSSSHPARAKVLGAAIGAVAPGVAKITASLPGTQQMGVAAVTVNNEQITELVAEPNRLDMSVGDIARLRILGRAASGTYELYPQNDLAVAVGGPNAAAIRVLGANDVNAVSLGQAALDVKWQNRLTQQVPVTVNDNPLTDLRIDPPAALIRPGQSIVYQVTAMRGGQRRVLGPESGVQLLVGRQDVAQSLGGLAVRGNNPGSTTVTAQVGNQRAEANLEVMQGLGPGTAQFIDGGRTVIDTYGPGYGRVGGVTEIPGVTDVYGATEIPGVTDGLVSTAEVVGLRFVPEVLKMGMGSPPMGVRVVELRADGTLGRDVTTDPALDITNPPNVVAVEKTAAGPAFRPVSEGQVRVGAKLGNLTADPLLVAVGEQLVGMARLEVVPDPLTIWSGETGTFSSVCVNPGGGQQPFNVDFRITPPAGQGVVASAGDKAVRGLSPGSTPVTVSVVDPNGAYGALSATARVEVVSAAPLTIQPAESSLQVGDLSPQFVVTAQSPDGTAYQVPAALQSMDEAVLAADPQNPGRFVAKAFGGTQIRAEYRGREAFAKITVSGARFQSVETTMKGDKEDFDVGIRVLAAESEGPLEYRVYAAGQAPPEAWVPAQLQGNAREATLRSPRMAYGSRGSVYQLMIEARDTATGKVQQYPLTFRLKIDLERTDIR